MFCEAIDNVLSHIINGCTKPTQTRKHAEDRQERAGTTKWLRWSGIQLPHKSKQPTSKF